MDETDEFYYNILRRCFGLDDRKHSIDDEQLDRFLKAFETPKRSGVSLEAVLKLTQVLAIVIGGAWVFVRFLDHDRETAEIGVERDRIALRQAEISLETIQRRAELSDIEYEQTVALTKLEVERLELQNRANEVEFDSSTGRIIDYSYQLKISKGKIENSVQIARYNAEFRVEVTNKSDDDLSVDSIVIDKFRFLGVESQQPKSEINIIPISSIPRFYLLESEMVEGQIVDGWEFVGREVFLTPDFSPRVSYFLEKYGVDTSKSGFGGSMLGVWRSGETTYFRKDYVIHGKPGDYVGFIAVICFNQCRGRGVWTFPSTKILPFAEASPELLGDRSTSLETVD